MGFATLNPSYKLLAEMFDAKRPQLPAAAVHALPQVLVV
jgi:hypothetical protein